jgi:hypothetical protein
VQLVAVSFSSLITMTFTSKYAIEN